MTFNPDLWPATRLQHPFKALGCERSEIYFLLDSAKKAYFKRGLSVVHGELAVDGVPQSVTALAKHFGRQTYLVTQSENPDLEAMILSAPTGVATETTVRYISGQAYFRPTIGDLSHYLEALHSNFPSYPGTYLATLVNIFSTMDLQVGSSFVANANEMHDWIQTNHPHAVGAFWETSSQIR